MRFFLVSFQGYAYVVEIFEGSYGRPRLRYDNMEYVKHYQDHTHTYWRCPSRKQGCRARLPTRTINGREMTNKNVHMIHHNHNH